MLIRTATIFCLAFYFLSLPAYGVIATHSDFGTSSDGFEGDQVGNTPAAWAVTASTFITASSPITANEGSNYATGNSTSKTYYDFPSSLTSGSLNVQFALYLDSDSGGDFDIGLIPTPPATADVVHWDEKRMHLEVYPGDTVQYASSAGGPGFNNSGLSVTRGKWQIWEIDYNFHATDIAQDTFSLTITDADNSANTNTAGPFPGMWGEHDDVSGFINGGGGPISALSFGGGGLSTFYVDTLVPEPSSAALLDLGVIGLCGCGRRRKRS